MKKYKLKKIVKFKIIQVILLVLIWLLVGFALKDATTSYSNYKFNAEMLLLGGFATIIIISLEDFIDKGGKRK